MAEFYEEFRKAKENYDKSSAKPVEERAQVTVSQETMDYANREVITDIDFRTDLEIENGRKEAENSKNEKQQTLERIKNLEQSKTNLNQDLQVATKYIKQKDEEIERQKRLRDTEKLSLRTAKKQEDLHIKSTQGSEKQCKVVEKKLKKAKQDIGIEKVKKIAVQKDKLKYDNELKKVKQDLTNAKENAKRAKTDDCQKETN